MSFKYFMTSNFGGGGQTVPRLFKHLHYFNDLKYDNISLLLNYRYLSFFKKNKYRFKFDPVFNSNILEELDQGCDNLINKIIEEYTNNSKYKLLKNLEILIDSGSGAIANHLILEQKFLKEDLINFFKNLIHDHHNFLEKNNVFSAIAFDYSLKNTYKKNASKIDKEKYYKIMNDLISNNKQQIELIKLSLNRNYSTKLYAPIHGSDKDDYLKSYLTIRKIEESTNKKFYGFALGGLGHYPRKKNGYSLIAKIIKSIKDEGENRKIHVLGSAAIMHIPTLIAGGASSFDCHSPWRRAMDGGESGSPYKILVPLLKNDLQFNLDSKKPLQYIDINTLNKSKWNCDCRICSEFSIDDIIKMLNNRSLDIEEYYRGLILIYLHAVFQHSYLLAKIKKDNIKNFINSIPSKYMFQKNIRSRFENFKDFLKNEIDFIG